METLQLSEADGIATLTLSRPKALNALNSQLLSELRQTLRELHVRTDVRALILTGAGEKAFVAGADISELAQLSAVEANLFSELGHEVMSLLEGLPFPTLAAVNGFALGGGCELAISCDLIYASEKAKFGLPEVSLGLIPGFGGTQRLTRLLGRTRAKELIFTGDLVDAAKAKEIGLALDVLPADQLMPHCLKIAQKIATRGPLAVKQAKRAIEFGADTDLRTGNELERQAFSALFGSHDQREGTQAFLEKRQATFKGH